MFILSCFLMLVGLILLLVGFKYMRVISEPVRIFNLDNNIVKFQIKKPGKYYVSALEVTEVRLNIKVRYKIYHENSEDLRIKTKSKHRLTPSHNIEFIEFDILKKGNYYLKISGWENISVYSGILLVGKILPSYKSAENIKFMIKESAYKTSLAYTSFFVGLFIFLFGMGVFSISQ